LPVRNKGAAIFLPGGSAARLRDFITRASGPLGFFGMVVRLLTGSWTASVCEAADVVSPWSGCPSCFSFASCWPRIPPDPSRNKFMNMRLFTSYFIPYRVQIILLGTDPNYRIDIYSFNLSRGFSSFLSISKAMVPYFSTLIKRHKQALIHKLNISSFYNIRTT
jgi:hypothetical protein